MNHNKTKATVLDDYTEQFQLVDVIVNPATNELINDSKQVQVEDKVMKVLVYLVSKCDRIVSRKELFEQVWPDVFVSQASLNRCISILRKILSDSNQPPRIIRTIRNSGYRIICPVKSLKATPTLTWKEPTFRNNFNKMAYVASGVMITLATAFFVVIFFCFV